MMLNAAFSGASLEEVWGDAATYGKRASPGTTTPAAPRPVKTPHPKTNVAKTEPSCAKSDPLCDLYNRGFSTAFDDIMDSYSTGDMYNKVPYSRTRAPLPGTDSEDKRAGPFLVESQITGYFPDNMGGASIDDPAAFHAPKLPSNASPPPSPRPRPRPPRYTSHKKDRVYPEYNSDDDDDDSMVAEAKAVAAASPRRKTAPLSSDGHESDASSDGEYAPTAKKKSTPRGERGKKDKKEEGGGEELKITRTMRSTSACTCCPASY